ncbi:class I SAM-dependent methyltransferase [Sphaerobacter thermophilus]|uniref:Methyltransferase type 11 n=1 Tax=Sphaerobacter thermophilus (strain ATCC 49802 / DSM 20745 / KCCM 41009 / NCIMB 13125 / S 6022) TaxID=479434 RepID=D1CAB1_SPHTD|nr:class I SAM-dependent methyltransferase [Sphaerobacter thermophilus]ACZ40754.1 Methyltransferase type 11 [Sphaerobacter thermophilus DSM 20745]
MTTRQTNPEPTWDARGYDAHFAFIWEYGSDLIDLLAPQPGERILDLGCGTGHLTRAIADHGAHVTSIDRDPAMIAHARANYPDLPFEVGDAAHLAPEHPFDAVFSNAVLHWISDAEGAAASIRRALRPGGRLVAEFGGRGNVKVIVDAVADAVEAAGHTPVRTPWYFPSIGEYAVVLERHGLEPIWMALIDRPTPLDGGADGLRLWLTMFGDRLLAGVPADARDAVIRAVEERLRSDHYRDGTWYADYRRLRLIAIAR